MSKLFNSLTVEQNYEILNKSVKENLLYCFKLLPNSLFRKWHAANSNSNHVVCISIMYCSGALSCLVKKATRFQAKSSLLHFNQYLVQTPIHQILSFLWAPTLSRFPFECLLLVVVVFITHYHFALFKRWCLLSCNLFTVICDVVIFEAN